MIQQSSFNQLLSVLQGKATQDDFNFAKKITENKAF